MPRSALLAGPKRLLVGLVATGAVLATPAAGEAKTFKAKFTDPASDGTSSAARDVVAGRVAYNRRTGVLSASVEVQEDWADDREDALVVVIVSDLVRGKCRNQSMAMVGTVRDPSVPFAFRGPGGVEKPRFGQGAIDGTVFKMRVKAKALSGVTPGCVMMAIVENDQSETVLDETAIDNGFR